MEEQIFKPRYSAGHWAELSHPLVIYLISMGTFLLHLNSVREIDAMLNWPYEGISSPEVAFASVLGLFVLLGILSFFVNKHIRKIEINDDGMILHRVVGVKIPVDYSDFKWDDTLLITGKQLNFILIRITNREVLKSLLSNHLKVEPEEPVESQMKKNKKVSAWYDLFVLFVIVAIFAVIAGIVLLLNYISKHDLSSETIWIADVGLACGAIVYLYTICRKMFPS